MNLRGGEPPVQNAATTQLPTWEFDVGESRQQRVGYGIAAFGVVALAVAALALAGFSAVQSLGTPLLDAGGQTFVQGATGVVAGLLVGAAEAFLLRRAFSGYGSAAFVVSSAAGGLVGGLLCGFCVDTFAWSWLFAGAAAGAVAGLLAGASQVRRLAHGNPAIWISYHSGGWALIWGVAWAISWLDPGSPAGTAIGAVTLVFASGILTVLALQKMPQFEF
jgi:MFS family permease